MKISIILFLFIVVGCKKNTPDTALNAPYLRWVGDIVPNPIFDDASFSLCNNEEEVMQYFNNNGGLEYEGEKLAIIETFEKDYNPNNVKQENGLIRIRFIVNCEGKSGRFRLLGMDESYESKKFHSSITDQILSITKSLNGWKPKSFNGETGDYYQYLIFKIEDGRIKEILP